ncbi:autotransporter domain-containing protein [Castellaniella sp. GW247-6E4]|uniref:autotransporter outer membrane beta-barrel domain-containing protein n=1 Tax=Castellaniella sp. GW247-6E4 TaxID=3140380 RepID=UPI00331558FA
MKIRHLIILALGLGLPGPSHAQLMKHGSHHILGAPPPASPVAALLAPEAPWDPSPAPFLLTGDPVVVDRDRLITRELRIQSVTAIDVAGGHVLRIEGTVGNAPATTGGLYKLGAGHMALSGANTVRGNSALLQGSLALLDDRALGAPLNALDINIGTRLEFAEGVSIGQTFTIKPVDLAAELPAHWWAPVPPPAEPLAVQWVVERGEATHLGDLFGRAPLIKQGAGTLRLAGWGAAYTGDMTVRDGGLRVDGAFGGRVLVEPGAALSGTGLVGRIEVGGVLAPGAAHGVGTLMAVHEARLLPGASMHVRIDAAGEADRLWSLGTAAVDGALHVQAQPGAWDEASRWTIVQADGGLEAGRFASASSNLPYFSPVLEYGADRIVLALRRNQAGLETCADGGTAQAAARAIEGGVQPLAERIVRQDCARAAELLAAFAHSGAASWRGAVLEDSRHLREAALAHAGSGRAWVRQWMVAAERDARSSKGGTIRGDARDVMGVLAGVDRALSTGWHLGVFAGAQHVDYGSLGAAGAPGGLAVRDASLHLGLGIVHRPGAGHRLSAGVAHAWHRGAGRRWTVDDDSPLRATQHARSTQAWVEWRYDDAHAADHWTFAPVARLAWVRLDSRDYTETGGPEALHVQGAVDQRAFAHAALGARRAWPVPHGHAVLRAALGWDALLGSPDIISTQSFREDAVGRAFEAGGQPLARHALRLDLGVDAPLAPGVRGGIGYTGQYRGGGRQHGVLLSLSAAL